MPNEPTTDGIGLELMRMVATLGIMAIVGYGLVRILGVQISSAESARAANPCNQYSQWPISLVPADCAYFFPR